jgi:CBS domain-containing protein
MDNPLSAVASKKMGNAVETAAPGDAVSEVVEKMHEKSIGALPVVECDKVVGIFTERDALYRVIHGQLDPTSTSIGEVMTKEPECVSPELSVIDAMRTVDEKRFRHLPLV